MSVEDHTIEHEFNLCLEEQKKLISSLPSYTSTLDNALSALKRVIMERDQLQSILESGMETGNGSDSADLTQARQDLEKRKQHLVEQLQKLKEEQLKFSETEQRAVAAETRLQGCVARVTELRARNQRLQDELVDVRARCRHLELTVDSKTADVMAAERTVAAVKAEYLQQIQVLQTENGILKDRLRQTPGTEPHPHHHEPQQLADAGIGDQQHHQLHEDHHHLSFPALPKMSGDVTDRLKEIEDRWSTVDNLCTKLLDVSNKHN